MDLTHLLVAVIDGPDAGWVATLTPTEPVCIGRGHQATVALADPLLSREHCRFRLRGRRVQLRDSGSGNGTRVRRLGLALPVSRRWWQPVRVGSRILVGASTVQVRSAAQPPPVDAAAGGRSSLLPLLFSAGTMLMLVGTGRTSPWRWVLLGGLVLGLGVSVLIPWWRRRRRAESPQEPESPVLLDPAGALAMAARPWPRPPNRLDLGRSDIRHARARGRRRCQYWASLPLPPPGGGVAVTGADGQSVAVWLLGQLLLTHPQVTFSLPRTWGMELGPAASAPAAGARGGAGATSGAAGHGPPGWEAIPLHVHITTDPACVPMPGAFTIILAPAAALAPRWCSRVIVTSAGHDRRVQLPWLRYAYTLLPRTAASGLPDCAVLADHLGDVDAGQIRDRWQHPPAGLGAAIGIDGDDQPLWLDLVEQGPHALIAGTTGAGKSELLLSWMLMLARNYPPQELSLILVDYKGGATFGSLVDLPHVAGVLTDLEPAGTARALASLRAELRRRERILASTGCAHLADHRTRLAAGEAGEHISRLLVVVDEFRAMADDHPQALDELVRLAAQGRSLGIHLILATQRPSGAVNADVRANVTVRICLRVLEDTDSVDVIGTGQAAQLPPIPGRFLLRTDDTVPAQALWAGPADDGLVDHAVGVMSAAATTRPHRPWAPELPAVCRTADVAQLEPWRPDTSATAAAERAMLPLLLVDVPEEQRLGRWSAQAHDLLLIAGGSGRGRSTAAHTCAQHGLAAGVIVHLFGQQDPPLGPDIAPDQHAYRGTMGPCTDVVRIRRLLQLLGHGPRPQPEMLIIDDVARLIRACDDQCGPGAGADLVADMLRQARIHGLGLVVTGDLPLPRWAEVFDHQLILGSRDPHAALVAGVPKEWAKLGPPGRGVLSTAAQQVRAQVALAGDPLPGPVAPATPWPSPIRLMPIPDRVHLPAQEPCVRGGVVIGAGGDHAAAVTLPLEPGSVLTVVGGAGQGRSTALATIEYRLRAAGAPVTTAGTAAEPARAGAVLLLDDGDRAGSDVLDAALAWVRAGGTLVVACRIEGLISSFHPLLIRARDADVMLTLGPVPAAVTGRDIRPLSAHPRPGRGVLMARGDMTAVQVDTAGTHAAASS